MLFNSHVFIFAFLPATLLGYFLLGARGYPRVAALWLTAASLFFYAWWNPHYLAIVGGSIVFNYALGVCISKAGGAQRLRLARGLLALGACGNLGLLAYYKYAGFFVENASWLLGTHWHWITVALPLGVSFFTFTQIAYLVDAYHGVTREYDFLYYALFVTFFPHLIAGPIVLYRNLMPQFARPETYRFHAENLAGGITLFILGLAKKVIIADQLSTLAGGVFDGVAHGQTPALAASWIGVLAYTLQLYFDFSGYSDMAIGLGRMFNVRFPLNFDSPYQARDIIDFWRRWHITLSTFLRDHVYIPLGGNRYGGARRYLNLFLTMLLGGLWHGAAWTFVVWGGLHGIYLVVNRGWLRLIDGRAWAQAPLARLGGRILTLLAVIVGWVFFRAGTIPHAIVLLRGMAGQSGWHGLIPGKRDELLLLLFAGALALFAPNTQALLRQAQFAKGERDPARALWRWNYGTATATALLFVLSVLYLSHNSEFLYFQF